MKTQLTNIRISWIDMAKGYGTILVIYAHLGVGELWTLIYSFHLPLFFFLSGYVFSTKYEFTEFLVRKIKAIIFPYFGYGSIMITFELLWNKFIYGTSLSLTNILFQAKLLIKQQRLWTLWFMACLFFLNLGFYMLVKICKKNLFIILISLLLPIAGLYYYKSGGTPLYWNIDTCLMAIPFFTCGYIYKLHNEKIDTILKQKAITIPLFGLLLLMNILTWKLSLDDKGLGLEMYASNYGNPIFTYIAAFSGLFCVVIFSKHFSFRPIQYIGENSMIYYALHQTVMMPITSKILAITKLDLLTYIIPPPFGIILHKWVSLILIIAILTGCNLVIKTLRSFKHNRGD